MSEPTHPPRPYLPSVTIVGVGLLGGSLGMALRRHGLARRIVGFGRNIERLSEARRLGAIDACDLDLSSAVAEADLIVLCTPVKKIIEVLPLVGRAAKPGALVTDVGSTKEGIVAAARGLAEHGVVFVGSHPMAGSDRSGVEFASADLYADATVFVTVDETTPKDRAAEIMRLWRTVGARVVVAHPRRHDRLVAAISHLPHLLAVAAVRTAALVHNDENFLRWIIGNGFRDTTRVAQGSVDMWNDICATNPAAILEAIDLFEEQMQTLRAGMAGSDLSSITNLLSEAKRLREGLEPQET